MNPNSKPIQTQSKTLSYNNKCHYLKSLFQGRGKESGKWRVTCFIQSLTESEFNSQYNSDLPGLPAPAKGVLHTHARTHTHRVEQAFYVHYSIWQSMIKILRERYFFLFISSFWGIIYTYLDFPGGSAGKESSCNEGDLGLIPGLGRSPGEGKGYPLWYFGLGNSMDCIVHGLQRVRYNWENFTSLTLILKGTACLIFTHLSFFYICKTLTTTEIKI